MVKIKQLKQLTRCVSIPYTPIRGNNFMKKTPALFLLLLLIVFSCSQESNYLNNINISEIILPNDDNTYTILELTENDGNYQYRYMNNDITVIYYKRDGISKIDEFYSKLNIERIISFENLYNKNSEDFPYITWHQNIRFNSIANVQYVDSFIFLAHDEKQLARILYTSTNNYLVMIRIAVPVPELMFDIYYDIYQDANNYFVPYDDPHNNENIKSKNIMMWDHENDGMQRFGDDLINGINESETAALWFANTEDFLERIKFR